VRSRMTRFGVLQVVALICTLSALLHTQKSLLFISALKVSPGYSSGSVTSAAAASAGSPRVAAHGFSSSTVHGANNATSSTTTANGFNYTWSLIHYTPKDNIDGFSSIYRLNECVVLLGKRKATPDFQVARADLCQSPPDPHSGMIKWDIIGGIPGYTGAHTYYFGSISDAYNDSNTVISATGDTGNPCIIRSTDQGKTWTTVLSYRGKSEPRAIFSPMYLKEKGEWAAYWRDDSTNTYVLRSHDDGLTWTKQNSTQGLHVGPRRVQIYNNTLYYSGVFGPEKWQGLYTAGYSVAGVTNWTGILVGKPIFAGVTVTSRGTVLAGEYATGARPVYVNLYRKGKDDSTFSLVLSGTAESSLVYFRQITEVVPGVLFAFLSCDENSQNDKDMQIYKSLDDGLTWTQEQKLMFKVPDGNGGFTTTGVNAVYGTVVMTDPVTKRKFLLAAAQPNNMVLRLDWDQ